MLNKLFPSTFIYMLSYSLTRFVGFILLPLYTNRLSPAEFGDYSLLMATYAILNVLYQAGLLQGLTGLFFNDKLSANRVVKVTFSLLLTSCFFFALVLTIIASPVSSLIYSDKGLAGLFTFLVWILFIDNISFLGLQVLKTERKPGTVAKLSIISALINVSLNILFLAYFDLGVVGILLAQAASGSVLLVSSLPAILKYFSIDSFILVSIFSTDKEVAKNLLRFSLPFVFAGFFGILMDVADRFIIDMVLERRSVGLYGFAYKISSVMSLFIIAFRTAYLPTILSLKSDPDLPLILRDTFNKMLAFMLGIFLLVILFAKEVSTIEIGGSYLINPEYSESMYLIPILLIAYMFNGLACYMSLSPYLTGKTSHFIISDAIGLAINIVLNFFLIPRFGIAGAAGATLVGFMINALYLYIVFISTISVKFAVGKITILTIGAFSATVMAHYWDYIIVKIGIMILYAALVRAVLKPNQNQHPNKK